jgi:predicted MPP superfamily phosphohydrolase
LREATIEIEPGPALSVGSPRRLQIVRATLPVSSPLPDEGLRIVHLSDLHVRSRGALRLVEPLHRAMTGFAPHLLLFTGDLTDDKRGNAEQWAIAREVIGAVSEIATWGSFGIPGNHDGMIVGSQLAEVGLGLIDGRLVRLEVEPSVTLLGVSGAYKEAWPGLAGVHREAGLLIAMAHYPDEVLRLGHLSPEVFLAGHTHGGQICLPGGRPVLTNDGLPRRMVAGIHRWERSWLSISRGVGTTRVPVRLWSPPEVSLLTLVAAGADAA